MVYDAQEKIVKLFDDYSTIASEAKYKTIHGEGIKILTPKQMLRRLPIALSQEAGNTSENLLNDICQIIQYILCIEQMKLLKKYVIIIMQNRY